jgi:hypothetical protein
MSHSFNWNNLFIGRSCTPRGVLFRRGSRVLVQYAVRADCTQRNVNAQAGEIEALKEEVYRLKEALHRLKAPASSNAPPTNAV